MKHLLTSITLSLMTFGVPLQAEWYDRKAEGWFWFENPPQEEPSQEQDNQSASKPKTARQELKEFQDKFEEARAEMFLRPTVENVEKFQELNLKMLNLSNQVSHCWRLSLIKNPHLDSRRQNPTTSFAKNALKKEDEKIKTEILAQMAQTYGLYFVFDSRDKYAQTFWPIIRDFSQKHGFTLVPLSQDGNKFEDMPTTFADTTSHESLGVKASPALVLVDPQTNQVFHLAYSVVAQEELEDNALKIQELMNQKSAEDPNLPTQAPQSQPVSSADNPNTPKGDRK